MRTSTRTLTASAYRGFTGRLARWGAACGVALCGSRKVACTLKRPPFKHSEFASVAQPPVMVCGSP